MEQANFAYSPNRDGVWNRQASRAAPWRTGVAPVKRIARLDAKSDAQKPNTAPSTILIVGDDAVSCRRLRATLAQTLAYEPILAAGAAEAREALIRQDIDVVLLDMQSPDADGFALAAEIGDRIDRGLLIVSALDDDGNRLKGLRCGADDVLGKPCNSEELLLKVAKLAKRIARIKAYNQAMLAQRLRFGSWTYDPDTMALYQSDGQRIKVSSHEKRLLALFLQYPGRVFSRQKLLDALHPDNATEVFDRAVDSAIARLRRRIEKNPKTPQVLKTVYGEGYVFDAPVRRLSVVR